MKKDILVTGGNGFLGSYIVKELLQVENNNITILCRSEKIAADFRRTVKIIGQDITDKKVLIECVRNYDTIYHVAGNIKTPETDIAGLYYDINSKGTLNLLEACKANDIKRFVYISTCEVYGNRHKEGISEDDRKEPANEYAKSKLMAEEYCRQYAEQNDIKISVIRPSYIYGYGQYYGRLFPRLIQDALSHNRITLKPDMSGNDFIYVKDTAYGIVLLGEQEQKDNYEVFNISSGKFTTIKDVFETVKELTGKAYDMCSEDEAKNRPEAFSYSIEKIKNSGYNAKYNLKTGLRDVIKIYKSI